MNIRGFKFQVDTLIMSVQINVKFQCKLQVVVKRGSQKFETQPINLENGIAQINEAVSFTMSVNFQEAKFEEKKTQFFVILVTDKGNKNAGSTNLDMSQYLNMQKFGISYLDVDFQEDLLLDKCPDKNAKIRASFKISQIGQLENEPNSADQSLDLSQVSILTPGRESFSNKTQQPIVSEKKLNESKSQLFQNDSSERKLSTQENQIKDLQLQNQNLKLQISEMIDKDYYQQIVCKYEQELTDLQSSYKQVCNENQTINMQFKAKVNIMSQQADEIINLQSKIKEYELEKQESVVNLIKNENSIQTQNQQQIQQLERELESRDLTISDLEERLQQINQELEEKNQQLEIKQNQYNDKLEQIQNLKNLTSGTISALSQRNEVLEKRLSEQKEIVEKLKEPNNLEELQTALNTTKQDLEQLQQRYDSELARKDDLVQNLQQKLEDALKKELDTSKTSQESKIQAQQLEQQVEVSNVRQDRSLAEQQLARLRSQVQVWQSKWESNQKVLSDYTNEVQQMSRQVADIPSFIEDQRELPEQLQLLKRAIQRKLQSYQVAQQHLEQEVQRLEQELEVCQYKLKLEQSQQCSDSQFQEKMHNYSEEITHLNSVLEQKNLECSNLQQQVDQLKQSEIESQKLYDEAKTQLNSLRQNYAKTRQQLQEVTQNNVMAQAKTKDLEKALKEKSQELQKNSDLIAELEQYNIQMEEGLSGMLDQYKIQNQQIKQTYEKEKAQKQELQKQIKLLKDQLATQQKGMETLASKPQETPVCNCKEKIQNYEQQIAELQYQITQMQIQLYENAVQRNSIAQIRTSVLMSRRESLFRESVAVAQQEEIKKEEPIKNGGTPEIGKVKELEEKVVNLQDERIKVSKEYQTVLERALLSNSQLEQKYSQQIQYLNSMIEQQQQELVVMKLKIGDMFNAAIEVGGASLVDKLQIALGLKE